jgi:hypothetical protein
MVGVQCDVALISDSILYGWNEFRSHTYGGHILSSMKESPFLCVFRISRRVSILLTRHCSSILLHDLPGLPLRIYVMLCTLQLRLEYTMEDITSSLGCCRPAVCRTYSRGATRSSGVPRFSWSLLDLGCQVTRHSIQFRGCGDIEIQH